jgi:hypothetical protein
MSGQPYTMSAGRPPSGRRSGIRHLGQGIQQPQHQPDRHPWAATLIEICRFSGTRTTQWPASSASGCRTQSKRVAGAAPTRRPCCRMLRQEGVRKSMPWSVRSSGLFDDPTTPAIGAVYACVKLMHVRYCFRVRVARIDLNHMPLVDSRSRHDWTGFQPVNERTCQPPPQRYYDQCVQCPPAWRPP